MKTSFILPLLLILIGFSAEQSYSQNSGEPLFTEDLGVQMYSFRNVIPEIGIEPTLDYIRDHGITEIEGGSGDMSPEKFKELCDERGIRIPSTGAGYQLLIDNPFEVIERAKTLGSDYVMVSWIPHDVGNFSYEDAAKAVIDFNETGEILKDHGLTMKYHFHGYELIEHADGTLLDYMIQNTDPEYVSFQMDVFWVHFGGGDPAGLLRKYGDRWASLHLKDMEQGTEKDMTGLTDPETNVVLGTGEIDIEEIIRAAREVGIKHYFIEDESSRVLEQIPESIEYLRSLRK
jgi:sugar phosphate isomerase/epimerase